MRTDKPMHTEAAVILAAQESRGVIAVMARRLGVTTDTVDAYLRRYPNARKVVLGERRAQVDLVEDTLFARAIKDGHVQAAMFILSSLGRDRGYGNRVDINHSGRIHVSLPDDMRQKDAAKPTPPAEDAEFVYESAVYPEGDYPALDWDQSTEQGNFSDEEETDDDD